MFAAATKIAKSETAAVKTAMARNRVRTRFPSGEGSVTAEE
jgi:hypothetical protein